MQYICGDKAAMDTRFKDVVIDFTPTPAPVSKGTTKKPRGGRGVRSRLPYPLTLISVLLAGMSLGSFLSSSFVASPFLTISPLDARPFGTSRVRLEVRRKQDVSEFN
jgi:hypothetical protein